MLSFLLMALACGDDTTGDSGLTDTPPTTTGTVDTAPPTDTGPPTDTAPPDPPDTGADQDQDGWATPDDCDDSDDAVNPDADELCNGRDDDCDGTTDEPDAADAPTWYRDADGDGHGDPDDAQTACGTPHGYVAIGDDCDDDDARYHPGAAEEDCTDPRDFNCDGSTGYEDADGDGSAACEDCDDSSTYHFPGAGERCDDTDEDCDGTIDEDVPDAPTWYGDADGDGYGGNTFTTTACDQPFSYVDNADDCDDLDGTAYPGAPELCDDADDDCDGTVDEDGTGGGTFYGDSDGDGYGDADDPNEACEAPSGTVDNAQDCDDSDGSVSPAGTEVCGGTDEDCDGDTDEAGAADASTWYLDLDGDGLGNARFPDIACEAPSGHVADDTDCDDLDAAIYPGAPETCDGADGDCDGTVDEDATDPDTFYADADSDGYGDPGTTASACDVPSGHTDNALDCDDGNADVNPTATEVCDGVDNDCDGGTDDEAAVDGEIWYADADGDGFGDPDAHELACEAPTAHVDDATDCDDADATVHPDATETCDGIDNDCSGTADDDASDATSWYADTDGDGYGDPGDAQDACEAPTGYIADGSDCDDGDSGVNPDAVGACDGVDVDCDGSVSDSEAAAGDSQDCPTETCLAALSDRGGGLADGLYWLDPLGTGSPFEAWCDMATDGGGYTMLKLDQGSTHYADDAEAVCDTYGLQLFIPRTADHLLSAWTVAMDATIGPDGHDDFLYIMGVYPRVDGSTCSNTALRSDNSSCDWVAGDGGVFYVSDMTSYGEPNGDNDPVSSMYYNFDTSGIVTDYNDLNYPGYGADTFICSATDE